MSDNKSIHSNAETVQKLKEAFGSLQDIPIPIRDCQDVPEFLKKLKLAQEATKKHSIKFG